MSQHLDIKAVCRKIGGTKPVDLSTVYRKIHAGELPRPIKLGRVARWREPFAGSAANHRPADHEFVGIGSS